MSEHDDITKQSSKHVLINLDYIISKCERALAHVELLQMRTAGDSKITNIIDDDVRSGFSTLKQEIYEIEVYTKLRRKNG